MAKKNTMVNIIKGGLSLIGGFGIGVMAKTAGGMLTPENAGRLTKFACKVGTTMIAVAVSELATNEVNKSIDAIHESMQSMTAAMNGMIEDEDDVEEVEAEVVG